MITCYLDMASCGFSHAERHSRDELRSTPSRSHRDTVRTPAPHLPPSSSGATSGAISGEASDQTCTMLPKLLTRAGLLRSVKCIAVISRACESLPAPCHPLEPLEQVLLRLRVEGIGAGCAAQMRILLKVLQPTLLSVLQR